MTDTESVKILQLIFKLRPEIHAAYDDAGGDAYEEQLAEDLIAWFNSTEPAVDDLESLVTLVKDGKFSSWECPTCDARVYLGEPEDWSRFQGVRNADYVSYPGLDIGEDDKRCDNCRMNKIGLPYIPEGYHLEAD